MDKTEQKILRLIDENRDRIIEFAEDIAAHPEPGFEERRTAEKTAGLLRELGYEVHTGLALTGVRELGPGKRSESYDHRRIGRYWMQNASHGGSG